MYSRIAASIAVLSFCQVLTVHADGIPYGADSLTFMTSHSDLIVVADNAEAPKVQRTEEGFLIEANTPSKALVGKSSPSIVLFIPHHDAAHTNNERPQLSLQGALLFLTEELNSEALRNYGYSVPLRTESVRMLVSSPRFAVITPSQELEFANAVSYVKSDEKSRIQWAAAASRSTNSTIQRWGLFEIRSHLDSNIDGSVSSLRTALRDGTITSNNAALATSLVRDISDVVNADPELSPKTRLDAHLLLFDVVALDQVPISARSTLFANLTQEQVSETRKLWTTNDESGAQAVQILCNLNSLPDGEPQFQYIQKLMSSESTLDRSWANALKPIFLSTDEKVNQVSQIARDIRSEDPRKVMQTFEVLDNQDEVQFADLTSDIVRDRSKPEFLRARAIRVLSKRRNESPLYTRSAVKTLQDFTLDDTQSDDLRIQAGLAIIRMKPFSKDAEIAVGVVAEKGSGTVQELFQEELTKGAAPP